LAGLGFFGLIGVAACGDVARDVAKRRRHVLDRACGLFACGELRADAVAESLQQIVEHLHGLANLGGCALLGLAFGGVRSARAALADFALGPAA
jgi:hypothetical protein